MRQNVNSANAPTATAILTTREAHTTVLSATITNVRLTIGANTDKRYEIVIITVS